MTPAKEALGLTDLFGLAREELASSVNRKNILGYRPYPKQIIFHESPCTGRYLAGANRAGKTDAEVCDAIWTAMGMHPFRPRPAEWGHGPLQLRFVVVDVVKGVEGIILPKLRRWCATSMLIDGSFERSWDARTLVFTFSNGSTIQFLTWQMTLDKHGGVPLHAVFFDEEPPQDVFNENLMRLLDYKGFWVIAATPVNGMTWTFDLLWEPAIENQIDYVSAHQLTQDDNPYLLTSKAERGPYYVGMNAEERAIREEGAFVARSGLVFPNWSKTMHVLAEHFQPPREWTWYSSVDFGWANPTAWLWHAAAPDGRIITFAEHYASQMTTDEHAAIVRERERSWRRIPDIRIGDPAGNQKQMNTGTSAIAMYAAHEIYIGTEVPKDPMVGIEKLQQYYRVTDTGPWGPQRPRWVVSPNCVNLIRELKKLRWAEYESQKKQYEMNKQEVVHKKDDHAFDSKRYLASLMPDLAPEVQMGNDDGTPIHLTFEQIMELNSTQTVDRMWDTQPVDDHELEKFW
jgi:phage terminase large subunit-like protein